MAAIRSLLCLAMLAAAAATEVTPIEQVLKLVSNLRDEVVKESKAEAALYSKFAKDCKTHTEKRSKSVKALSGSIGLGSAGIASKSAKKDQKGIALGESKAKKEKLIKERAATDARCAKEKAEYEAQNADTSKAISSLDGALKKTTGSKPSLLQEGSRIKDVRETIELADMMGMLELPKHKAVASMLQSGTSAGAKPDPRTYDFHSQDIIDTISALQTQFTAQKKKQDDQHKADTDACNKMKKANDKAMAANTANMKALSKSIQKLEEEIGELREKLISDDADLKDDELFLKDLTAECEARAVDWDQRAQMSHDEIEMLSTAFKVLKGDVKGQADAVNQRALLQKSVKPKAASAPAVVSKPVSKQASKPVIAAKTKTEAQASKAVEKPVSFIQTFLAARLSSEEKKAKALQLLTSEGQRVGSLVLTSLAHDAAADPFEKVKGLVQKLIERLVNEATGEATKKGFCDTELGKAETERDYRSEDTQDLSADLEVLEAKRDELQNTIKAKSDEISDLNTEMSDTTKDRQAEKAANEKTLSTAHEGLENLENCVSTMKEFWSDAAKATVSFVQTSPIEEAGVDAGFSGSNNGKQTQSKAILDLLDTIVSDFERTIRTTEASEESSARTFVADKQRITSSLSAADKKKELSQQDLAITKDTIDTKMTDLESKQSLLDKALKELEELKPVCIDSGMSYATRVAKRETEMKALQKAVCILGGEVTDGC